MSTNASHARSTAHGTALIAAILYSLAACKGSHAPPSLPALPTMPESGKKKAQNPVSYRNRGGSPIAPSVIPDDPAPTQAQSVTANPTGQRATLNGDPNGITRDTLNRAVQGAMGAFAACFASLTEDPMVSVSFEADPTGKPSLVRVSGAPQDAEHCIRNVVQDIRFPSFEGKGVQVDLPLSFHRVAHPAQPGASPGGQQPSQGAPLFLQP